MKYKYKHYKIMNKTTGNIIGTRDTPKDIQEKLKEYPYSFITSIGYDMPVPLDNIKPQFISLLNLNLFEQILTMKASCIFLGGNDPVQIQRAISRHGGRYVTIQNHLHNTNDHITRRSGYSLKEVLAIRTSLPDTTACTTARLKGSKLRFLHAIIPKDDMARHDTKLQDNTYTAIYKNVNLTPDNHYEFYRCMGNQLKYTNLTMDEVIDIVWKNTKEFLTLTQTAFDTAGLPKPELKKFLAKDEEVYCDPLFVTRLLNAAEHNFKDDFINAIKENLYSYTRSKFDTTIPHYAGKVNGFNLALNDDSQSLTGLYDALNSVKDDVFVVFNSPKIFNTGTDHDLRNELTYFKYEPHLKRTKYFNKCTIFFKTEEAVHTFFNHYKLATSRGIDSIIPVGVLGNYITKSPMTISKFEQKLNDFDACNKPINLSTRKTHFDKQRKSFMEITSMEYNSMIHYSQYLSPNLTFTDSYDAIVSNLMEVYDETLNKIIKNVCIKSGLEVIIQNSIALPRMFQSNTIPNQLQVSSVRYGQSPSINTLTLEHNQEPYLTASTFELKGIGSRFDSLARLAYKMPDDSTPSVLSPELSLDENKDLFRNLLYGILNEAYDHYNMEAFLRNTNGMSMHLCFTIPVGQTTDINSLKKFLKKEKLVKTGIVNSINSYPYLDDSKVIDDIIELIKYL